MDKPLVPREKITGLSLALELAETPAEVVQIETEIDAIEHYMRAAGLWDTEEIRPVNETRMRARWKLGRLLAVEERAPGARTDLGTSSTPLKRLLAKLGLTLQTANEAQRIGKLPPDELEKVLALAAAHARLASFDELITYARPYWYKANRQKRHKDIAAGARMTLQHAGPFPLIYADPPWRFKIYSEKGLERTPDQHYPTLTDEEIMAFEVAGRPVADIAHEAAALLLWCTSSNVERALCIMGAWGFEFKSSAVWVKDKSGLGLVFRNQHELLLYGTKGDMPGPQYQPCSVFQYSRGRHSAKPPEIRKEIEKMYPDFDARTRLELFARGKIDGWTTYGFETDSPLVA